MDKNRFASLIVGYCEHCGIKNPMDIVHGTPVEADGVLFSLVHGDPPDPSLLLIAGDAGDAPKPGDAAARLYALLLQNFVFAVGGGPVFSISPDTGRLLLIRAEKIVELTPPLLAQRLEELAAHVRQWREPSFDAESEGASAPAIPRHASPSLNSTFRNLVHR